MQPLPITEAVEEPGSPYCGIAIPPALSQRIVGQKDQLSQLCEVIADSTSSVFMIHGSPGMVSGLLLYARSICMEHAALVCVCVNVCVVCSMRVATLLLLHWRRS